MRTLTKSECTEWLVARSILEQPYGRPDNSLLAEQFRTPQHYQGGASLLRGLLEVLGAEGPELLLQVIDWDTYPPDMMALVIAIRVGCGESRPVIESPGHLFAAEETDLAIGFFSLTLQFQWSVYVYVGQRVTLFNWEGDLIDVWTSESDRLKTLQELFQAYGLKSTFSR